MFTLYRQEDGVPPAPLLIHSASGEREGGKWSGTPKPRQEDGVPLLNSYQESEISILENLFDVKDQKLTSTHNSFGGPQARYERGKRSGTPP